MNKTYISEKYSLVEALNEIDAFIDKMEIFMEKHPEYSYTVEIDKNSNKRSSSKWVIKLNVKKDERIN